MVIVSDHSEGTLESRDRDFQALKALESRGTYLTTEQQVRSPTKVRFGDVQTLALLPKSREISEKMKAKLWWTSEEIEDSRSSAKSDARSVMPQIKKAFEDGYQSAQIIALTHTEDELYEYCSEINQARGSLKQARQLANWRFQPSIRGLEHWASQKHHYTRKEVLEESRAVVVELSRQDESVEELAKQSQEYTRSSRILARIMGEADAIVARECHEETFNVIRF